MYNLELFKVHLTKRSFSALLIEYSAILSWVSIFVSSISNRYPDMAAYYSAVFSFFVAFSIFVGAFFMGKTDMNSYYVYVWSSISPIITISLIFSSELWFLIAVCLLGGLYGNLLLKSFTGFSRSTMIRERGRIGGFIGFISIIIMLFLTMIGLVFGFAGSVVLCSLLSLFPLFAARLGTTYPAKSKTNKAFFPKKNYWLERDFFLYLMPWIMYNLINAILGRYQTPLLVHRFQIPIAAKIILPNLASCIGALLGGAVADLYGRKKALAMGLTSYGIGSAFSGLFFLEIQNSLLVLLSFVLTGLSWGIFLVLYFFVVWEDLANMNDKFSYYAGFGFYPLSMGLAQFLPPITQFPLVNFALVSCVLIFSSNIFLAAAQELLSPEARRELDLILYLEQAKKFFKSIPDKLS